MHDDHNPLIFILPISAPLAKTPESQVLAFGPSIVGCSLPPNLPDPQEKRH